MFALTHDEAEASGNVVEGMIYVLSHSVRALMDSGASHSFVSESFVGILSQFLQPIESDMAVVTPGGEELLSSQWFSEVVVEVSGHCLLTNLRVLKMHDFDVIFRMDWLSRHRAHLNCFEHCVMFRPIGEREFSFRGSLSLCCQPVLSFLEARSLIYSTCPVFLACLVSLSVGESSNPRAPYNVPIVSEFVNVFLEELPSLPPHWEVNFSIDLVLSATPISKASYHLSLAELRELKK